MEMLTYFAVISISRENKCEICIEKGLFASADAAEDYIMGIIKGRNFKMMHSDDRFEWIWKWTNKKGHFYAIYPVKIVRNKLNRKYNG